jgi:hypothetical protein
MSREVGKRESQSEEANIVSRSGAKTGALRSVAHKPQICYLLRSMTITTSKGPKDVLGFKHFLDLDELRPATPDK